MSDDTNLSFVTYDKRSYGDKAPRSNEKVAVDRSYDEIYRHGEKKRDGKRGHINTVRVHTEHVYYLKDRR